MTRVRGSLLAASVALSLSLVGCSRAPSAAPDLARPRRVERAPAPPSPPSPPPLPPTAEVELSGVVKAPAGVKGALHVYVTDGDCWKGAASLADVVVTARSFFAEVIVPQNTRLWVCAAIVPSRGPIVWSGIAKGAPFPGRGIGEVRIGELEVTLARGKPVTPPPAKK